MKRALFIISILSLASCVQPRDTRSIYDSESSSSGNSSNDSGDSIDFDDSTPNSNNSANIPTHLSHCRWSMDGTNDFADTTNSHIGPSTVCQSRDNEADIYIQVANPDNTSRVCVIPTSEVSGNSIFLGAAQCKYISSSTTISKFTLQKNRDYGRYQNFRINGVMIMKEKKYDFAAPFSRELISYDAYFMCSINLDLYNNSEYCNAFKTLGEYYYKSF